MGNYLTTDQALARMDRQQALYTDSDDTVRTDWLGDDIDVVEGEINAYLSRRYATPVTAAPHQAMLRGYTLDLLLAVAYRRLPDAATPPAVEARAEQIRAALERIAEGITNLGGATENSAAGGTGAIVAQANKPAFTRQKLSGW